MPIIVDINALANVFDKSSEKHQEFKPVLDWIIKGKGKLVYGGSTFQRESSKTKKYRRAFNILKKINKTIEGNRQAVDQKEIENKKLIIDKDFDDPHIAAITCVTKCRLICTEDKRSIRHLKNKKLYPKGFVIPSFYTKPKNKSLLSDAHIDPIHKPISKLNKKNQGSINNNIA